MRFNDLNLWIDPECRSGPDAMGVDEWLLQTVTKPTLRVYRWLGEWGSIGYFGSLNEARASFPGVQWVRRWTGGGTVDHRQDWAYTLAVPKSANWQAMHGGDSYCIIHKALEAALQHEALEIQMSHGDAETGSTACFENPVCHDLVGDSGTKVAGAGQRRNRVGLLHQGSVALPCDDAASRQRAERLADALAEHWQRCDLVPPRECIAQAVAERYGNRSWTQRRA